MPQTEGVGRALLRDARVVLGGRRLNGDLSALRRVRPRHDYSGVYANCADTGRDWTPALARQTVRLHWPARVVYRSLTPRGAQVIRFIPAAR